MIQVVLSEHNLMVEEGFEQIHNVSRVYSHFAYNPKTFNNDILLIKVGNIIKILEATDTETLQILTR